MVAGSLWLEVLSVRVGAHAQEVPRGLYAVAVGDAAVTSAKRSIPKRGDRVHWIEAGNRRAGTVRYAMCDREDGGWSVAVWCENGSHAWMALKRLTVVQRPSSPSETLL